MMSTQKNMDILRSVPDFPNYTFSTFGLPERTIQKKKDSMIILGPPVHLYYDTHPHKSCQVHMSGIPSDATMSDVVQVVERFGKIFTIELSICVTPFSIDQPYCNGWARVTYMTYDGAQNALFAHLTRRIPGSMTPLSIYKGNVSNVVVLKNLPTSESRAEIIERINEYPGLISVTFLTCTTARVAFLDLDLALLFMDIVSSGGLVIQGFTCTVETDNDNQSDDENFDVIETGIEESPSL